MSQKPTEPHEPTAAHRLSLVERYRLQTWFLGIIATAVVLTILVQARFILISLVIAIIIFSLTTDAINSISRLRIGKWRITNWLASAVAFTLIATVLLSLSAIILAQINTVVTTTIAYTDQAVSAIAQMFAWMGPDTESAVATSIRSIEFSGYIRTAAGQAGNLLSATTLIILFVGFLFAERMWFATKLENLMGDRRQAERVGRIIRSIIRRVNHYLLVKTGVSAATGLAVYFVMVFFGLEFAAPMAILTFILNYLPSVGSIIATFLIALVAYMQLTEPATALLIFVLVGMIQFMLGSVIDPMLMGRTLRVSSFGIIISMAFWGALWGVPGMFLAVPIMVATMIVCSHIPSARPVAVLLSREGLPELDHEEQLTRTDTAEESRAAAE
ncbi:MAG: AI-2E family transporter [Pararhodobacter sp.]|nr:AI-2E family transporter [Pararhodobacter sp.]